MRSAQDYELFLYSLSQQFPSIRRSTLTFVRLGATLARVEGEIHFDGDLRLVVRERLVYDRLPVLVDAYGYEIWRGNENDTGTTLSPIPTILPFRGATPITNTFPPLSNTTASPSPR
jgi:hypothetical protein